MTSRELKIFTGPILKVALPTQRLSFQLYALVAASILICYSPHFLAGKRESKGEKIKKKVTLSACLPYSWKMRT